MAFGENVVTLRYYVGDSLVAMYDGICNATNAAGELVHDASATKWLDLSGNGRDFVLTAKGSWSEKAFEFDAHSATLSPAFPYYRTQEVRCQVDSGRWVLVGSGSGSYVHQGLVTVSGYTDRFQTSFYRSGSTVTTQWLNAEGFTAPFSTAVTYDLMPSAGSTACYCDGERTPAYTGANHWAFKGASYIGANPAQNSPSTSYGYGRIQAIRLYARVLTADEIARNALVDRVRFENAAPPVALEPSIVCSQLVARAESGGALLEWTAASFGWLGSHLDSFCLQYAASSDFASPTAVAAGADDETAGYFHLSSLVPGATYYARVVATNDLGAGVVGDAFTFVAESVSGTRPVVRLVSATPASAVSASLAASVVYAPAGTTCDLRAIVAGGGQTYTNVIAKAVAPGAADDYVLGHLLPATDYTVRLLAISGNASAESEALSFATPPQTLPPAAYVQDGLLVHLDAICNAVGPGGRPCHDASATNWTDLTGNLSFDSVGASYPLSFRDNAAVFPAGERILQACGTATTNLCDAILSGTFTVEAAAYVTEVPTVNDQANGFYSIGSGNTADPRTLCFDTRWSQNYSGKMGCIQYNSAGSMNNNSRLAIYDKGYYTNQTTLTVVGAGATANGALYRSGFYILDVLNQKKYTPQTASQKKLSIRGYSTGSAETIYNAFRAYGRSLTADEIALNSQIDDVRFRGVEPPSSIVPVLTLLCSNGGVEGTVSVHWALTSCGWTATELSTLTMEYAESPDFDNAVTQVLGASVTESGSAELSGLVPGKTYYARALAVNNLGLATVVDTFTFRASRGMTNDPAFTTGLPTAAAGEATFDLTLFMDGGAPCGGYAILSHDGLVRTNALFSGATAPFSATLTLAPLAPGCDYTAVIAVTNGLGGAAEEATLSFATAPDTAFVHPYVDDGLLGFFDGIFNATNSAGEPVHLPVPYAWTDLKGNFPMTSAGTIEYTENGVNYVGKTSQTTCDSAEAAVKAVVSGAFTVETLCRFSQKSATDDDNYGVFSFGSGTYNAPRVLCFNTVLSGGLFGALQYNNSGWNANAMMLHELDFTRMATYSVVGGGALFDESGALKPASLYINGEWTNAVPNNGAYTTGTVSGQRFAIHRYSDGVNVTALYHSFRIYDRPLSAEEVLANRVADEVRFLGREASLAVASATRSGDALVVTLVRSGADNPADIHVLTASDYGRDAESATGCRFGSGDTTATLSVALPPGTAYARFKAGGLVSPLVVVGDCPEAAGYAISAPKAEKTGVSSATIAAAVSVPDGAAPLALSAAYGYAPDALVWTNALSGAEAVSENGMARGLLAGLRPSRTYYCRVFGTAGNETAESAELACFTTSAPEEAATANPALRVVATNRVNGVVSSLTVEVASERATELWLFGDLADRGFTSNAWAFAEKLCDVPAGGGTFNVAAPAGWGSDILAFRLATGLAREVESVTYDDDGCVETELMTKGAFRLDIDFQSSTAKLQQRLFSLGTTAAGTLHTTLYVNSKGQWAYAWNNGDGNWEATGLAADMDRHRFTIDGVARLWAVDDATGLLKYNSRPYEAESDAPLRLFGHAADSATYSAPGTLWSCQVRGADGRTLIGDFIPAVSGGEACLYDRVSRKTYFANTGALTAGADLAGDDFLLVDPSPAFLYANANEVAIGADVVVTGHETGDTLTFSGTSANADRVTVNGHEATLAQDGSWTVTVTDGIVPGAAYPWQAKAWNGNAFDATPVSEETTRAASQLYWETPVVAVQRALTFSGTLSTQGANATTVRLLTGTAPDALTNTLAIVKPFDDDPAFSITWHAPEFDEEYFWALSIENAASNPANGHWFFTNAVSSVTTRDEALYTWQAVAGDWTGDWSDTAHWADDKGGDCLHWPSTPTATAYLPQGTVNVDVDATVKTVRFGADGPATITGADGHVLATVTPSSIFNMLPNGAEVLVTGAFTFNSSEAYDICGGSPASAAYAATFTVADGATFSAATLHLAREGVFIVRDATASIGNIYFNHASNGDAGSMFASRGGGIVLEGAAPLLTVGGDLRSYNKTGTGGGGYVEFRVPRAGYARTPLVMTGTGSGQTFCGDKKVATNSKPVEVRIAADSPLYGATGKADFELATWARKHTDGLQLVSLNPLRGAERDPKRRLYVTDDDLSLRVQFHTDRTLIMVR